MTLTLILLAYVSALEAVLWLNHVWAHRKVISALLLFGVAAATGGLLAVQLNVATILFAVFSLFRIINLLRILENKMHSDYLYHSTRKTSLWLIFYQLTVLAVDRLVEVTHVNILTCFYLVAAFQAVAATIIFSSTLRHIKTTKAPFVELNIPSRDLPTVTVAIPARNETRDLEECLRSLVETNYPKLEILVLDDNSQDRRTPEIIRGFAQQGVRFLAGKEPPKDWLAKNYAYQQLAEQANGEILLFCGVDARFSPSSLNMLVTNLVRKDKSMLSVMPQNLNTQSGSILIQPARYAWELSLPRRLLARPPVLSTCWLITREALDSAGGFKAVSRKIVPESYFARHASQHHDAYSFMHSDEMVGMYSAKSYQEQFATSVRTRYPQLHRRPELTALTMVAEFTVLVWPLLVGTISLISAEWLLAAVSLSGYLLAAGSYALIVNLAYRKFMTAGFIALPAAALLDIFLLGHSMWQYEFGQVIWKDRNVSLPVMKAVPSLPQV